MAGVIWEGRPGRGLCCAGQGAVILTVGLIWALVSAAFTAVTWLTGSPLIVPLLGAAFALFGVWMTAEPVRDALRRGRTSYRLTEAGLHVSGPDQQISYPAAALGGVRVVEHRDGSATLWTTSTSHGGVPLVERVADGARIAALFDRVHLAAEES